MTKSVTVAIGLLCMALHARPSAAADDIHTGWAASFHTLRIDERLSLVADFHARSTDEWSRARTLIGRFGVTYAWRPRTSLGAGYAFIETLDPRIGDLSEHRLWQQVVLQRSLDSKPLTHRFRLEQRQIERAVGDDVHSFRLRYSARLMIPLAPDSGGAFSRGNYVALQNELFLHLSGAGRLNGKMFDQNRAYVGIGRRFSPNLDLELGYVNQFIEGRQRDTSNHAIQLAVYTRH